MKSNYYLDKVAVVTGAASGLGLGFSEYMLNNGLKTLWMADYNVNSLEKEANRLNEKFPGKVLFVVTDCSKWQEVEAMVERAARESGVLDLIFNNAGKPMTMPSDTIEMGAYEKLVALNITGAISGTLAALRIMIKQGHGHIINTASMGGLVPVPFAAGYGSTKAALIEFTRCLAIEYYGTDLHFSQISPMNVATNIFSSGVEEKLTKEGWDEEAIKKYMSTIAPPPDAMPLDEAVDYVMSQIAEQQLDIIVGYRGKEFYDDFCHNPERFMEGALEIAAQRRHYYEEVRKGNTEIKFPI